MSPTRQDVTQQNIFLIVPWDCNTKTKSTLLILANSLKINALLLYIYSQNNILQYRTSRI